MIVVPDEPVATILDGLRRRFDPHVDLVPPHITVAFPAEPVPVADTVGLLDRLAASVAPFDVSFSAPRGPAAFDGQLGDQLSFLVRRHSSARGWVVVVADAGAATLLALRRSLSPVIPQPAELLDFPPYLTLGQSLESVDAALSDAAALFQGPSWRVTELLLVQEGTDGRWETVRRSPLHGPGRA